MEMPARFSERKNLWGKGYQYKRKKTAKEAARDARIKEKRRIKWKAQRKEKAKEQARKRAQQLRENMTETETLLWNKIRHWPKPYRPKAQQPIGYRIADFAFLQQHVVVEVDGPYHLDPNQRVEDQKRTWYLKRCGFEVIRFTDQQIYEQIDDVVSAIQDRIGMKPMQMHVQLPPPIHEIDDMIFSAVRKP
jgi:very-short-patch-repair endonuclease